MAKIRYAYSAGSTLFFTVKDNATEKYWNKDTSAFETYSAGNVGHYAIPMSAVGGPGQYEGTFPTGATGSTYWVSVCLQSGASPAVGDLAPSLADITAYDPASGGSTTVVDLRGTGSDTVALTIGDSATSDPLIGADVWVTTDSTGSQVIAGVLSTNDSGTVDLLLAFGTTYYAWARVEGYNRLAGASFIAASTVTLSMIALTANPQAAAVRYGSQGDLEDRWGVDNVARWSQLDNTSTSANLVRIAKGMNWACDEIDNAFRGGPYAVPLTPITSKVTDWFATLAGFWIYRSRGIDDGGKAKSMKADEQAVRAEMALYRRGELRLNAAQESWEQPTVPSVVM